MTSISLFVTFSVYHFLKSFSTNYFHLLRMTMSFLTEHPLQWASSVPVSSNFSPYTNQNSITPHPTPYLSLFLSPHLFSLPLFSRLAARWSWRFWDRLFLRWIRLAGRVRYGQGIRYTANYYWWWWPHIALHFIEFAATSSLLQLPLLISSYITAVILLMWGDVIILCCFVLCYI